MLSKDERKFDRNGDGRLNAWEHSDWYEYTYGIDNYEEECAEVNEAENRWASWLNDTSARLVGNFEDVLEPAELIMGKCAQTRELAEKTYMHFLSLGLLSGSRWHETDIAGNGNYTARSIFLPYKAAVRSVINAQISVCTFEDVDRAIMGCSPLFESVGVLTNKRMGSFWRALYRAMPTYRPNSLSHFGRETRTIAPDTTDEVKIEAFNLLLESLFPVFTYFSGKPNAEALLKCRQYSECAERHWKESQT